MEIVTTLLAVGSGLAALLKTAYSLQRERNSAHDAVVHALFTGIANTLDWTVTELREGRIPHGACAAMEEYAQSMGPILSGVLDPSEVARYADQLQRAHHVEQLMMAHTEGTLDLRELERVVGVFRAAAVLAQVTP